MRVIWGIILGALVAGAAVIGYIWFTQERAPKTDRRGSLVEAPAAFDDAAFFATLKQAGYKSGIAPTSDIDALIAALPANVAVTYDSLDTDGDTNSVILRALKITASDNPDVGVKVDTAQFWGFDTASLVARFNGENLDASFVMAERIDVTGIQAFGLGTLYQPIADSQSKIISNLFEDWMPEQVDAQSVAQATQLDIEKYDVGAGRLIMTNVALHPFVLNLIKFPEVERDPLDTDIEIELLLDDADDIEFELDVDSEVNEQDVVHQLQKMAAWSRSISFDGFAIYDSKFEMTMTDYLGNVNTSVGSAPLFGYHGFDRGDLEHSIVRDVSMIMEMAVPIDPDYSEDAAVPSAGRFYPLKTSMTMASQKVSDLNLGLIYDHLARGAWPDKSITKLMSLGYWEIDDLSSTVDEKPLYALKNTIVDLRGFYGFFPSKFRVTLDDASLNWVTYMEMIEGMVGSFGQEPDAAAEQTRIMSAIVDVLKKNDFVEPAGAFDFGWNWNPQTGDYDSDGLYAIEKFLKLTGDSDLDLPTYDAIMAHLSNDMSEEDEEALGKVFSDSFAFNRAKLTLSDRGGIDKSFAMAIGVAELMPEDAGASFLVGAKVDDLRVMAATTMRLSAGQAAQAFPPAKDYILALADFISKGGTLTASFVPPVPVTSALLSEKSADGTMDDDAAVVNIYGFTLEHKGSGTGSN